MQQRAAWLSRNVLPIEPVLRSWLQRRRVPGLETDDVVQEVYGILAGLPSVDAIRDVKAYVFSVARSVLYRHLRRAKIISIVSLAELDESSIPDEGPEPESRVASHQELRRVIEQIARLPAKCREVFVMRKVEGLSQAEIAARMGIAESTVEKHIGKGIHTIMQFVARGLEPDRGDAPNTQQIANDRQKGQSDR
ncbi:MAG: RNA polymerase sigma factor [Steroidobacteraceae bacterium]